MLSLMTIAGFAFGGFGDVGGDDVTDTHEDDYLYETDDWAQDATLGNLVDPLILNDAGEVGPVATVAANQPEVHDFDRGDTITGFDPATDQIELEYTASLGIPDVTVTDFSDGSGASIALNGVVVADIAGAQGLDPNFINLVAV